MDYVHENPANYPRTTAGCGAVMVGAGSDEYVLKDLKFAQRTASLKMPAGYCANDPQQSHLPVIYFHDRPNISPEMISKALDGAEPLFEMFYLGSVDHPVMDHFQALPGKTIFPTYFKWLRPQVFQVSPFKTTLSIDGDAIPCSGARLAKAFDSFYSQKVGLAGAKHMGGLNMGVVIFDTEKARPQFDAWAKQIEHCILSNGSIRADQQAMDHTLRSGHLVDVGHFADTNICRRAVKTKGCLTASCWVDHRPPSHSIEEKMQGTDFDLDIGTMTNRSTSSC